MIGSLRGVLLERRAAGELLVEVGGVGYRVQVPTRTLVAAGEAGDAVFLHVHTHVRDDAIVLFGFGTDEERACFEALIGAHGVGPSLALTILSHLSPASLRRAVATDDLDALCAVPNVGKKTAARMVIELKTRLDVDGDPELTLAAAGDATAPAGARADVRAALAGLGYAPDEISSAVRELPEGEDDPSALLRVALRALAVAR
ncbi:MAG TPA: Holliday junction branch migration protein RuvA [Acidimicrobiales bacterium]|nr:Holliday junction branch migration protein RuvA [Acidimicrobiales bacterium]